MATMVKEKRRNKKKSKEKQSEQNVEIDTGDVENQDSSTSLVLEEAQSISVTTEVLERPSTSSANQQKQVISDSSVKQIYPTIIGNMHSETPVFLLAGSNNNMEVNKVILENFEYRKTIQAEQNAADGKALEDIRPSAPLLEEEEAITYICENIERNIKIRIPCMPMEQVIRLFGEKEIAEVNAISAKQEAIVEAGPQSGSDHPLVDLLSTFRTSLIAIKREQNRINGGYAEEKKSRATLWNINKRTLNISRVCPCGATVSLKVVFDVARLQKEKMPAARLKLEALLRDVQESYVHHQQAFLQAYYDINELLAEILQNSKDEVREALLLVLQALRLSDAAPETFAKALQRWASVLSASLLDARDLGHLLFLLHSIFRQTRSVQWAAPVLQLRLGGTVAAARLLGLLELLLVHPLLEEAQECTEESESWEELDKGGEGGAVVEGRLRERDLLALLEALPLSDLLARMVMFTRNDITKETDQSWGDRSGGHSVLKASCGIRVMLSVLQRALAMHCTYKRLRTKLQQLAVAALEALAELHMHSRHAYTPELDERIAVELEACFAAGLGVLGEDAHKLPASLLSSDVAKDYCNTLIVGLHDPSPLRVESLRAQCGRGACSSRVRAACRAVLDRELDHELATIVLEFLFEVGIKRQSTVCKGSCDVAARDLMPEIVTLPGMHAVAFRILADLNRVEAVEPTLLQPLAPQRWRPTPAEAWAVLHDWGERCGQLIQHLLLSLDYTPHTGISLETQLSIGKWLCAWLRVKGEEPEWAWQVLRALRVHRTQWALPLDAPEHEPSDDLLSAAFALLASDWGHCVPLVCGPGARALLRLSRARAADAALCAALAMRVMALSPESVSLTPTFSEVFAEILSSGPSLVQRALGRRSPGGQEALQRAMADSLRDTTGPYRSALVSAWLRALWQLSLPVAARALLDCALRTGHDWRALDEHAALLLQGENAREYIIDGVRHADAAPLLCEALLRRAHALETRTLHARLLARLAAQRAAGQRAHVDNALKEAGFSLSADELAIHRCAGAALAASWQHPAHLLLWRLFLQMFLQRLPASPHKDTNLPVGALFFSGLVKSRTLSQLKKRLQETAACHHTQADTLKAKLVAPVSSSSSANVEEPSPTADDNLFRSLDILDLTGTDESESDSDGDAPGDTKAVTEKKDDRDKDNLIRYHLAAEKLLREYLVWLEQGEAVRALPHQADVARFLPEQVLDTAWRASLDEQPPSADTPTSPLCPPAPATAPAPAASSTHCERAVRAVLSVRSKEGRRFKIPTLPVSKMNTFLNDSRAFVEMVRSHLKELENLTREWVSDVERLSKLDAQLWELVGRLRERRPLPAVRRPCVQCRKPLTLYVDAEEWCVSEGAQRALRENRRSAAAAVLQLSRPRAHDARVASRLRAACRQIRGKQLALSVVELALEAAPRTQPYAPARDTVRALITDLAARFISADGQLVTEHLGRWGGGQPVQQALCLALVSPLRLRPAHWTQPYVAVLRLRAEPHVTFSYVSKFDLSVWADAVDTNERTVVLEALIAAACSLGRRPNEQQTILLELLGVHSSCAARPQELCAHVLRCGRACVAGSLPAAYLPHLPAAVARHGARLDFDELGHVLRQLGMVWWKARHAGAACRPLYAEYAPYFGDTLYSLTKEFVAAAVRRTYRPERVATYAWSALHEAWSPWVWPQRAAPLLPAPDRMLARFGDTVLMVMQDCPGSEDVLLRQVFQWSVQTHLAQDELWPQECRVLMTALLLELSALPWQRQWFHVDLLQLVLQVSRQSQPELPAWCSARLQHLRAECWLCGVADAQVAPTLAVLLEVFTSKYLNLPPQTLSEACALPWARLPEPALSAALERYFCDHYSPAQPYHHAPHFCVMLSACHLLVRENVRVPASPQAAEKRAVAVSHWTRAQAAPALGAHVRDFAACLLDTLTDLAPHIEESPGELEQLLSRAAVIMCMEPAAAVALPVWQRWVAGCPPRLRCASASAVATLTTADYFAALGDAVAKAVLAETDGGGWAVLRARWAHCPWAAGAALATRGALHAAYGMLLARPDADCLAQALHALLDADINFASNDAIIAVWICVATRAALAARADGRAARTLLARWAEQRRTLLQVVTLHSADRWPAAQHRILCRLALFVISPSDSAARAYEAACSPLLDSGEAWEWNGERRNEMVPRLAVRLFPRHEVYFKEELALATESEALLPNPGPEYV